MASTLNSHFEDSGLFGMQVHGPANSAKHLFVALLEELAKLKITIPSEELERAKNILKMNILMAMERKEDRLEEIARNYMTYRKLTFLDYCDRIDAVTS
jgi:predicted Zn-dependent peptidase